MTKREQILPYIGRMEQVASIRRYSLEDGKGRGMRAFEVMNASGFGFTVYPDRGLDIGPASWNGKSLTWMSRNGFVAPSFYDASGIAWLRSWMGGLLTTCGWMNVGNPSETATGSEGLHGRADHTPAEEVNTRCYWEGDVYRLEISGKIVQSCVFGENLVTERTISTAYGHPGVTLIDRTENIGSKTLPFMQLYHMNFGYPLISETASLCAGEHKVLPRDAQSEAGLDCWATMPRPTADFAEQVMYHDLPTDADGFSAVKIVNPEFFKAAKSLQVSFRKAELPYLVQWRQAGIGDYVMGLEPANCYPVGQEDFAKTGLLRKIEPGQIIETCLRLKVADDAPEKG